MSKGIIGYETKGPPIDVGGGVSIDHGVIGSLAVLEATGAIASLRGGLPVLASYDPGGTFPAGAMFSHASCRADGTLVVGLANLTGVGLDPAAIGWDARQFTRDIRQKFGGRGFNNAGRFMTQATLTWGLIAAAAFGEAGAGQGTTPAAAPTFVIAASPVNALPAGIAMSHLRSNVFQDQVIALANISAAGVTPGALAWNLVCLSPLSGTDGRVRTPSHGPRLFRNAPNVSVDSALIAAKTVLETSFSLPGCRPGDVIIGSPTAALPAGIALSHFRPDPTTPDTAWVGLANLTAAGVDPAPITFNLAHFTKCDYT